jgi:NADH:ubiquinone oxidoreductase subunit K
MSPELIYLFLIFCGLVGIFLRRNLLNIIASFLQIIAGINAFIYSKSLIADKFGYYVILVFTIIIILFIYAIALLLIRRRSTLHVNEVTEMRG